MLLALLEIGFPLNIALEIMSSKFEIKTWQTKLNAGQSFYQVLADSGFDADVLLIIKLGLDSEELKVTIAKSIEILKSKIEKRTELIELIKYPLMLLVIGSISISFVSLFLLPQFAKIIESMGASSTATTILYTVFKIGPDLVLATVIAVLIIALIVYKLEDDARLRVLVKISPLRNIYISLYNQVFTVTLSNLLQTNLHISDVFALLSAQQENKLLASEALKIKQGLTRGNYIVDCLSENYYDQQLLYILKIGEESGMLVYYLNSYSKIIAAINQNRGKRLIFWIQPIFYAVFGILILLLYAAIFIPMFTLMDSI